METDVINNSGIPTWYNQGFCKLLCDGSGGGWQLCQQLLVEQAQGWRKPSPRLGKLESLNGDLYHSCAIWQGVVGCRCCRGSPGQPLGLHHQLHGWQADHIFCCYSGSAADVVVTDVVTYQFGFHSIDLKEPPLVCTAMYRCFVCIYVVTYQLGK